MSGFPHFSHDLRPRVLTTLHGRHPVVRILLRLRFIHIGGLIGQQARLASIPEDGKVVQYLAEVSD